MDLNSRPPPGVSWRKVFELGIPEVDAEHETFLEIVGSLHAAMTRGGTQLYLEAIRDRLERYAAYHFSGEEEFLAAVAYPGLPGQQREHAWFVRFVRELRLEAADHGSAALALAREWLVRHILENDRAYTTWLARTRPSTVVEFRRSAP